MLILKGLRGYFYIFGRGLTLHKREKARQWLVSAFGGKDLIRRAYRIAVESRYRFYSYGDAMLIL